MSGFSCGVIGVEDSLACSVLGVRVVSIGVVVGAAVETGSPSILFTSIGLLFLALSSVNTFTNSSVVLHARNLSASS